MKWIKSLLLSVFISIGLYTGYQSVMGFYYIHLASTWPHTEGVIQDVGFSGGGSGPAHASARLITYSYRVDGARFLGNTEYFGSKIATNKQTTGGYMRLAKVDVFYNPDNPSQSVLKPHSKEGVTMPFFGALAFLLFGIVGFLVPERNEQKHQ